MRNFLKDWEEKADIKYWEWDAIFRNAKRLFAKLIGAKEGEIVSVPNTSTGLGLVANMIKPKPGTNAVIDDLTFHSVAYNWLIFKKKGVEVRYARNKNGTFDAECFTKVVDEKTAVVNICHVTWNNGFRFNLREIAEVAHKNGAYFVVDCAQSAGAIKIDVKKDDVDFLVAPCFKWLLGPAGAGFLYVREELIDRFDPPIVGWMSVTNPLAYDIWNMSLQKDANKFETGTPALINYVGAEAALKLLHEVGPNQIEDRVLKLSGKLIEELTNVGFKVRTPVDRDKRAGIVNFEVKNPEKVVEELKRQGVVATVKANGVRVSPHFYNTEGEIETFIEKLKKIAK